ncbi:MAG: hypothetical protein H0U74_19535 [Bradymonadaceae bacterium]|nr:hypothetical protein [Lujinxingiaceae bacterium]
MTTGSLNIYIMGHRASGKTSTARLAGKVLGLEVIDLDAEIEARAGQSCAEIIAASEPRFRALERKVLATIVAKPCQPARIIVLGGGFHPLPTDGACIWLYRDGWEPVAREARHRLRPDVDFEAELAWMIDEREPRFEQAADLRLDVSRGRRIERVAEDLATWIGWLLELQSSPIARRTWVVAAGLDQLAGAVRAARLFGLAGVEVRSDLVDAAQAQAPGVAVMASLRTPQPDWLAAMGASAAFDIDIAHLDAVNAANTLASMPPRPLILSSHPANADIQTCERLLAGAESFAQAYPAWAEHITLKWAPVVSNYSELLAALDATDRLRERGRPVTFLPQGARFAWCRPPLAVQNATNYVPVGLAPHRRRFTSNAVQTPLDFQAWLVHMSGPVPTHFQGLIGDPVDASQGDVWHRRAARREGVAASYVKIAFGREESAGELARLLVACERLSISGLSVTAPLKQTIVEGRAVNTLRLVLGSWQATDTDEAGMRATLAAAASHGFGPGSVAIIGQGGVSEAILRAIDGSDWKLVHHASGRLGWSEAAPEEVTMVVNAVGDSDSAYVGPPRCQVWVDLHYAGVRAPAPDISLHFNGDTFFDAQAHAQRLYWQGANPQDDDHA